MEDQKHMSFESRFDIDKVSFKNVSKEFEREFRKDYRKSLDSISDARDPLTNASGVNSLGILEKMAQRIDNYDTSSNFEDSYQALLKEFQPFTET